MALYIYGEAHFQPESVTFIQAEIERIRPQALVHELVYNAVLSVKDIRKQLANCDGQGWCDPEVNRDIFELADKLRIPVFGCDLSKEQLEANRKLPLATQFAEREKCMLEILHVISNMGLPRVVCVVGDIHLRTKANPELGAASCIAMAVKNRSLKADIIRVNEQWREAE